MSTDGSIPLKHALIQPALIPSAIDIQDVNQWWRVTIKVYTCHNIYTNGNEESCILELGCFLTAQVEAWVKLPACHHGVIHVPSFVAHCPPYAFGTVFQPALSTLSTTNQSNVSLSTGIDWIGTLKISHTLTIWAAMHYLIHTVPALTTQYTWPAMQAHWYIHS